MRTMAPMPQSPRIVCPNLTDNERIKLQACIDRVRSGEREFFVRVTNHKVTRSRKRVDGEDYNAKRALAPHAHEGWLVAAPTNKKGEVYIHIFDEARAKDPNEFGHTRITMMGIQSFEVVRDPLTGQDITRPGPLGIEDARQPAPKQAQAQQAQAQQPQLGDPRLLMAQAMFFQAQALMQMGQAMLAQYNQQPQGIVTPRDWDAVGRAAQAAREAVQP